MNLKKILITSSLFLISILLSAFFVTPIMHPILLATGILATRELSKRLDKKTTLITTVISTIISIVLVGLLITIVGKTLINPPQFLNIMDLSLRKLYPVPLILNVASIYYFYKKS